MGVYAVHNLKLLPISDLCLKAHENFLGSAKIRAQDSWEGGVIAAFVLRHRPQVWLGFVSLWPQFKSL